MQGEPQVNVIAVGIKVLNGVSQPSESRPGCQCITCLQRGNYLRTLLLDIGIRFVKGIVVKMIFIVTELGTHPVLVHVRLDDFCQRSRAENVSKGLL